MSEYSDNHTFLLDTLKVDLPASSHYVQTYKTNERLGTLQIRVILLMKKCINDVQSASGRMHIIHLLLAQDLFSGDAFM